MNARAWLLLSVLAAGVCWFYAFQVRKPWERHINVDSGKLKEQMGDLYPRWVGTRELLLHGKNPYGPEVSHEIQMAFYGHPVEQSYDKLGGSLIDEQRFVYPVYVVFLLSPTVHLDFWRSKLLTQLLFAILTAAGIWLSFALLQWHPSGFIEVSAALLMFSSPQILQGLKLSQLALLAAFLLVMSAWCVAKDRLALAGVLLAIATIKPQMVAIPMLWFAMWGLSHLRARWALVSGFAATLLGLVGAGWWILPGWPRYFVDGLIAYRHYFPTESLLQLALGGWAAGVLSVILVGGLLALAWRNRRVEAGSIEFQQVLAAFFVGNSLLMPAFQPFNQVLLILPVVLALRDWKELPRVGRWIFGFAVAWPPITSAILLILRPRIDSPGRLPLLPSVLALYVPFLVFLLLAKKLSRIGSEPQATALEPA